MLHLKCIATGAAAGAVSLPEPRGEAAGEPKSEQEAGGFWPIRGAGRGCQECPNSAYGSYPSNQRSGSVP